MCVERFSTAVQCGGGRDDGKAKLLGLIIDRLEVGSPQDYEIEKARTREELLQMLRERLGPTAVERFKKFVSEIKEIPIIEDHGKENDDHKRRA